MRLLSQDVDRLFASFGLGTMGNPSAPARHTVSAGTSMATWAPSVEVTTRGDDLVIGADLPGVKPDDVKVEIEGNNLIIQGESHFQREKKDEGYWYSERSYGSFYRSIPLPPGVRADNARAEFNNGVLEIALPGAAKSLQPQRRQIQVQSKSLPQGAQQQPQATQTAQGTAQQAATGNTSGSAATSNSEQPASRA